ncbi:MAG: protein smg [Cycloclasticus sp. symbiont of Bathymodiolus heckerae]|nr:MAG: protein smg [Cycloclasticus sp. symbiont of Bathymodiolus heckerae]
MKETIFEVLVYLFEHYIDVGDGETMESGKLKTELLEAGFTENYVDRAFDWMDELTLLPSAAVENYVGQGAIRIHSPEELLRFDVDAQGFLLFLEQSGIIDSTRRELIIDRAMALGDTVLTVDHIKWVALMVLFSQTGMEGHYSQMEELVYGDIPFELH